jgi:recombination protein RecT
MARLGNTPARAAQPAPSTSVVRSQIKALEPSISRAVPTGMSAQRFTRVVLTELSKNPTLERCRPATVLGAVMTAAQLGLEFGPLGHAYLVPYKDQCTLIVGYRGYIDLARRSGQLKSIVARPVHANDEFDFEYGTDERLTHRPAFGDRGPVIGYYGVALLADGGQVIHVMSKDDIESFKKRSKASSNGPWVTDYDAMACKTVIRRMVPWLPMSVEAAQAIETDEQVISWDGTDSHVDVETGEIIDGDVVEPEPDPEPEQPDGEPDGEPTLDGNDQ